MSQTIKIAINGAAGRMGLSLINNAATMAQLEVIAAIDHPGSPLLGEPLGSSGLFVTGNLAEHIAQCDVIIDFSTPTGCIQAARMAKNMGCAFISGTTGLTPEQQDELTACGANIALLQAANFSVGVNVLEHLVELASRATGNAYGLEVFEAHHKHKVDAPSGTALFLGEAAARGRDVELNDVASWARQGQTGPRTDDEIGFQVLRGGDIVGEHTVFLCGDGERLELSHRATDRGIFARGALRAALWIFGKTPGTYKMSDVLFTDR